MTDGALERDKAEARRRARSIRYVAAHPEAAGALTTTFPQELHGAPIVAGYWPLGSEIDPRPLMAMLAAQGSVIVLPRTMGRDVAPTFHAWKTGDSLVADAFGILAPAPEAAVRTPSLILAPLLAFDRAGRRLGQGGGHYDRILAALKPNVIAVGLAFSAQEVDEAPAGPHDQRLDWIVTEKEAIRAG